MQKRRARNPKSVGAARAEAHLRKRKKPTKYHLPVLVEQDEDGVFIVSVPTLRGCHSYGHTFDEAMKNIAEAAALCLEDERPAVASTFIGVRDLEIVA